VKKEHPNPQGQADKKMDWKKAEEMYSYEENIGVQGVQTR